MDLKMELDMLKEQLVELKDAINNLNVPVQNQLFTPEDAAKFLKVSKKSVYNYRRSGKLNSLEFAGSVRYTEKDLLEFASADK